MANQTYDSTWRKEMMKKSLVELQNSLSENKKRYAIKHNLRKSDIISLIRLGFIANQD